ncbi:hypothetical protein GGTG_06428 [Gaeumannomyces tritici R3-111a-1]|uniref:Protein kinase domain-containing protein n=1 Tax=Gaeumannomyces tritici (strain R3-111a-1) TaxID=644352 RepID=J3NYS6_GAET3|nr:hypothetical protein GGTG_06428 [Gaeumannomyces tritici R3-111a-1]EJT76509.1 hypothetical protein GGTG_06428 [Gaeumannomyces tritici R3-111a-1]
MKCIRRFVAEGIDFSFTRTSDLNRAWDDSRLRALFAGDLPGGQLDETQLNHLRNNALPLLSFASIFTAFLGTGSSKLSRARRFKKPASLIRSSLSYYLRKIAVPRSSRKLSKGSWGIPSGIPSGTPSTASISTNSTTPSRPKRPETLRFTNEPEEPIKIYGKCGLLIETQEDPLSERGSQGHVYFGRVHPDNVQAYPYNHHQAFRPEKPCAVAVKVFNRHLEALREVENLRHLKDIAGNPDGRYPNSLHHAIIHHYASNEEDQLPMPMVIFPFAELGNLWQFLYGSSAVGDVDGTFQLLSFAQRFPDIAAPPEGKAKIVGKELRMRLLEQCLALAGALRFLHGRIEHRDMSYKLAHMGLKLNNIIISSHPNSPRGTSTYQAPEVHFSWHGGKIRRENPVRVGRMSDLWSFGAIIAEVLAFAVGGTDEFEAFHGHRRGLVAEDAISKTDFFWEVPRGYMAGVPNAQPHPQTGGAEGGNQIYPAQVRPGVVQWLANIESSNPDCAPGFDVLYPQKERTPDTEPPVPEPGPEPNASEGVYLAKSKVYIVGIHEESVQPLDRTLNPPYEQPLPHDSDEKLWKGIASAGEYIVLYGCERGGSRSSVFNYATRVAVSPEGLVVLIAGAGKDLLMLNANLGCTVATKSFIWILGCPLEESATGRLRGLGQNPFKPQPCVLAVHDGRLLLTVDKTGSLTTHALSEAAAPGGDRRPTTQLGSPKKGVYKFSSAPNPGSQLRAFGDAGATLVLLCHVDGALEVARISPPI